MNDEQTRPVPPGWYPDPHGPGQRWWNGQAWHDAAPPPPPTGYGHPAPGVGQPLGPASAEQERTWAMWTHLGTLLAGVGAVVLTAGILGIFVFVVPMVFMSSFGSRSPLVRAHAVEELNFQLSVLIYSLIFAVGSVVFGILTLGLGLLVILPAGLILFVVYVVLMILATTAASRGELRRYPLTIRFVR